MKMQLLSYNIETRVKIINNIAYMHMIKIKKSSLGQAK